MDFDPSKPIWLQLVDEFTRRIATGTWAPGQRMPSVRDLAAELGVNPNTVQRALGELERSGLAATERTAGRFVTTDTGLVQRARIDLVTAAADAFIAQATGLRLSAEAASTLVADRWSHANRPHQEER